MNHALGVTPERMLDIATGARQVDSMKITKYEVGGDWPPADDHEASAGINVATADMAEGDWWWDRIECHGHTLIEAQQLRDRVLRGLYLEAQERASADALKPSQWPSAETGHD